jgi:hypothetical protein
MGLFSTPHGLDDEKAPHLGFPSHVGTPFEWFYE